MLSSHPHRQHAQGGSLHQYSLTHQIGAPQTPFPEVPRDYRSMYPQDSSSAYFYRRSSSVSEQEWSSAENHTFYQQSHDASILATPHLSCYEVPSKLYASDVSCPNSPEDSVCADDTCELSGCLRWRIGASLTSGLESCSPSHMHISRPSSRSVSSGSSSRSSTPTHESIRSSGREWDTAERRPPSFTESAIPEVPEPRPQYYLSNMHLIADVATTSGKMSIDHLLNPESPTSTTMPPPYPQPSLQQRVLSEFDLLHEARYNHAHHHRYEYPSMHTSSVSSSPAKSLSSPSRSKSDAHNPNRQRREKRAWDEDEIKLLLQCVVEAKHGGAKWRRVADLMGNGRSSTSCANKYKRMKHNREPASIADGVMDHCEKHRFLSSSPEDGPSDETMDEDDDEEEDLEEESSEGEEQ
ncbi:hypothetical protein BGZ93_001186 [Podila epicladia]|nr:hypothetical protein BGZ93_001186 [Podila epicladia]KAG0090411.1 hypothetical protein BGZ92_003011 [Podila epicladia]